MCCKASAVQVAGRTLKLVRACSRSTCNSAKGRRSHEHRECAPRRAGFFPPVVPLVLRGVNRGEGWHQLRGWPINWFLQLDPLVALGTLLTTNRFYAGLIWALVTIALTILLGRFFCGWVCPFGSLHQFVGWAGRRRRKHAERVALNQYRGAQVLKYYCLPRS